MLVRDIEVDVWGVNPGFHLIGRVPVDAGEVTGITAEVPLRFL